MLPNTYLLRLTRHASVDRFSTLIYINDARSRMTDGNGSIYASGNDACRGRGGRKHRS